VYKSWDVTMALHVSASKTRDFSAYQVHALCVEEGFEPSLVLSSYIKQFPFIVPYVAEQGFTGKRQTLLSIALPDGDRVRYVVLAGLGKRARDVCSIESYRRALGKVMRFMQRVKVTSVGVELPSPQIFGVSDEYLAQQTAIIATMADYLFDTYKEHEASKKNIEMTLVLSNHVESAVQKGVHEGVIIGGAVNDARHWVNLPANVLRPDELASQARHIANTYGLSCTVFSEEHINEIGMGGLAAVSQGAEQDCCLVILQYQADDAKAPTLGFVGKGITYD
jgi:leucyl aminopeptidase